MTSNCANVDEIQCESIGTEDVLSMCVVPVKVHHNQSDKEIITFVMLDTCSQGTFVTQSLMEQLSVKGIPTSLKIKWKSGKLQRSKNLDRIFGEIGNNENIKVDLLIGANCLEALEPHEVIPSQDKGSYAFRIALGWCVVGPMKAQQLDVISCNRIGVMKAVTQDTAEHHFEIEKECENFGVKEMLKKMYMTDFNEQA